MKIFVCTCIILMLVAPACSSRQTPTGVVATDLPTRPTPQQESFGVELYESSRGTVRYRIRAAYMATIEAKDSTYVLLTDIGSSTDHVVAEMFDEEAGTSTTIRAGEIKYFEKDHRFEARDSVTVLTSAGRQLSTEFLIWQEDTRRVLAPGFVSIKSDTEDIRGYGFESDEQLERFTLRRVTGQLYLEDS